MRIGKLEKPHASVLGPRGDASGQRASRRIAARYQASKSRGSQAAAADNCVRLPTAPTELAVGLGQEVAPPSLDSPLCRSVPPFSLARERLGARLFIRFCIQLRKRGRYYTSLAILYPPDGFVKGFGGLFCVSPRGAYAWMLKQVQHDTRRMDAETSSA